jgi:hypothetical protein
VADHSSPMSSRRRHVIFAVSSQTEQMIRTITLLLPPKRGVEGGLLKTAARKETEENFMLVEVESMCVCLVDETELWALC